MFIGIDGNEASTNQRVGSNIYAFELLKAIYNQDKTNEYLIYLREKRVADLPETRKNWLYRVIPPKRLWTQWRLPLDLYLHRPQPDLFFTPGHYAPRFSPVPTVISIMDLAFLSFPQVYQPAVLHQLGSWTAYSVAKASHIFAISQHTKQDIIKNYAVSPDKITVTYPGVHPRFRQDYSLGQIKAITAKYHLPEKYFIFIGTRQPRKNLDRLIQAVNQLSNISLVIVGKTWHQFKTEKLTIPHHRLIFTGYAPDEDLPLLMLGSQALVLPSLYEGFGIPVAEAMAVGCPVVVSNASSLPEIVGATAILVDPHSTTSITQGLRSLVNLSSQKKVQLVTAAQKRSLKFTWEACAKKTLEVLNALALH